MSRRQAASGAGAFPQRRLSPEVAVLPDADYRRFQDFFYRRTGIVFGDAKRVAVDRRLLDRMAATNNASLRGYLMHLRFDPEGNRELQTLINALTVNETYFYREDYQFRCLVRSILPEVVARRAPADGEPIRIWSLPCSTGEEPYSIALQLIENWPALDRHDVEIVASDIDSEVLRRAREGRYDQRAIQHLPATVLARHFTALPGGGWQISDALRTTIDFRPVNLNDRAAMRREAGRHDVIFCRNLLIYFDDLSRRQAAEALFDALRPGGFVCLGHSESMSRMSSLFTVRKLPDAIVYQRPLA